MSERTIEQIRQTISAARDSVWVITSSIEKIANGEPLTDDLRDTISRNVGHLNIVVSDPEITGSGEDISDLYTAITNGNAALV